MKTKNEGAAARRAGALHAHKVLIRNRFGARRVAP